MFIVEKLSSFQVIREILNAKILIDGIVAKYTCRKNFRVYGIISIIYAAFHRESNAIYRTLIS